MTSLLRVLVAEDDTETRALAVRWLQNAGLDAIEAADGLQAVAIAKREGATLDAVVCDVMMPGLDGFAVVEAIASDPVTANVPILVLTAHATSEAEVVRCMEAGAVDHMIKPFSGKVLVAKIRKLCERTRAEKEVRRRLVRAEHSAYIDPLTGLANRRALEKHLEAAIAEVWSGGPPLSVAVLDLDHFKSINDTFGHDEGDRVLGHLSDVIRATKREGDLAFRVGGEEFVVMLPSTDAEGARREIEALAAALRANAIELGRDKTRRVVTLSAGVAGTDGRVKPTGRDLLALADGALYVAKRTGRDKVSVATPL